jgi:hypothetical protein
MFIELKMHVYTKIVNAIHLLKSFSIFTATIPHYFEKERQQETDSQPKEGSAKIHTPV